MKHLLMAVFALALSSPQAFAQHRDDADGDGFLSAAEQANGYLDQLFGSDGNGDGRLSSAELTASVGGGQWDSIHAQFDANHDTYWSREEAVAFARLAVAARLPNCDADHDGRLSVAEDAECRARGQ